MGNLSVHLFFLYKPFSVSDLMSVFFCFSIFMPKCYRPVFSRLTIASCLSPYIMQCDGKRKLVTHMCSSELSRELVESKHKEYIKLIYKCEEKVLHG